jgi:hypothetical protein
MNNISLYLSKYLKLGFKDNKIKDLMAESIKEICDFEIDPKKIKIQNENLIIDVIGPEKSEIFINKEKIIKKFGERVSELVYDFSDRGII